VLPDGVRRFPDLKGKAAIFVSHNNVICMQVEPLTTKYGVCVCIIGNYGLRSDTLPVFSRTSCNSTQSCCWPKYTGLNTLVKYVLGIFADFKGAFKNVEWMPRDGLVIEHFLRQKRRDPN